ncbi:ParB/RepB/Spo0J family partition protein [Candidatus Kaiserbacteria bacterium]|nr:ParB/RepB/Spo0J family partition protein [Candidatus Kaiserbacteria bacterium]
MTDKPESPVVETVTEISLEKISPNPYQPRETFDETELRGLADSIREKGLLQPIVVRLNNGNLGLYQIVMGERRFRAFQMLERQRIPAIVRSIGDAEAREIALIENLQRDDLSVTEEAHCLQALIEQYEGSRNAVAEKIGKSITYVADRVDLLALPKQVQDLLSEGKINVAQGKVILELKDEQVQIEAARRAIKLNLSANELRGRMQRHAKTAAAGVSSGKGTTVNYKQIQSVLVRLFDALDNYDIATLGDANKRATLKKQMQLVQRSLTSSIEKLEVPLHAEGEKTA